MGAIEIRLESLKSLLANRERRIKNLNKVEPQSTQIACYIDDLIAKAEASKKDIQEQIDSCENAIAYCAWRFA
jgi:SMC interacting uncharacterized protein involved in chromosome segregation